MTEINAFISINGGKKQKAVITIPKSEMSKFGINNNKNNNKPCGNTNTKEKVVGINAAGKPIKAIEPTTAQPTDSLSKKGGSKKKTM